jgi:hypothetical protein
MEEKEGAGGGPTVSVLRGDTERGGEERTGRWRRRSRRRSRNRRNAAGRGGTAVLFALDADYTGSGTGGTAGGNLGEGESVSTVEREANTRETRKKRRE